MAKQCQHLFDTDQRLFSEPFTRDRAVLLASDYALSERVEAFVARSARLQDTLGDKLLPTLLRVLGESPGVVIDNLDRAERLGWLRSTDEWLTARHLRNRMVHEYVDDPELLSSALQAGHELVPLLIETADAMLGEVRRRGLLNEPCANPGEGKSPQDAGP